MLVWLQVCMCIPPGYSCIRGQKGRWILWSYRRLWAAQCGCWKQCLLLRRSVLAFRHRVICLVLSPHLTDLSSLVRSNLFPESNINTERQWRMMLTPFLAKYLQERTGPHRNNNRPCLRLGTQCSLTTFSSPKCDLVYWLTCNYLLMCKQLLHNKWLIQDTGEFSGGCTMWPVPNSLSEKSF